MESLFLKKKEFEKTASLYLDRDSTTWVKTIITDFFNEYPQLQNQPINISWKKKDANKGYAVGSLYVLNGAVPIIINNFQVAPLDVIMFGNAAIPLSTDTINEMLGNSSAFRGATGAQPKTSLNMFGDTKVQFSPTDVTPTFAGEGGITRDAVKVASFIDRIEHVDKDSVKTILTEIEKNALLNDFKANDTLNVIEKLASHSLISPETELESFVRNIDINRQYVYEDRLGNRFVKQANADVDYTWNINLASSENLEPMYNDTHIEKIAKSTKKIPVTEIKGQKSGHFVHGDKKSAHFNINSCEKCANLEKLAIFTNEDTKTDYIIDTLGNWMSMPTDFTKHASSNAILQASEPVKGDYGVFVVDDKITTPFTVDSMIKSADYYAISTSNLSGSTNYYPVRVKGDNFIPVEHEKRAFYVPGNAKFIKLSENIEDDEETVKKLAKSKNGKPSIKLNVTENLKPKEYEITDEEDSDFDNGNISKNAEFIPDGGEETLFESKRYKPNYVTKDSIGLFHLKGEQFDKYAEMHSCDNINKDEAIWYSIMCGASKDDIEKIASLDNDETYEVTNELKVPLDLNKFAERIEKQYDQMVEDGKALSKILVKEAAVLQDKNTVDAVLSLGLMRKYNIMEYLNLIPDYERVIGELAKLLIMIRLGLSNIPEMPVKTVMEALTTTVMLLKQVQKINKTNK